MSSMPQTIALHPTQIDVDVGVCNSPTKCMYAQYLRRLFPSASYIAVNPNGVTITLDGWYYHYMVPKRTVIKMTEFDNDKNIDVATATARVSLAERRPVTYVSTPAVREYHRQKSARRRADPAHIRPESKQTLRATVARSRKLELERKQVVPDAD